MVNHDRLFKELLQEFFAEFIDLFLPDVSAYLDKTSVEFVDKEVFTDITAGVRHEADLVVKARFKGTDSCFLIHVETQAHPQSEFPRRLFSYFARLYEKYNLPIYPIVVFSFDRPKSIQPCQYEVRFPDREVLKFNYAVVQLNQLSWRDFMQQPNPVAAALMAKMTIATKDRAHVKLECLRLLATLKLNRAQQYMISGFVDTYLDLTAKELEIYRRDKRVLSEPEQELIMEIETSWKREGRLEGRLEGLQEGRLEEIVSVVCRLLQHRFGTVEHTVLERVRLLKYEQLKVLSEALLDFAAIADLHKWLEQQERRV
jgi:predicted transposase YdaD